MACYLLICFQLPQPKNKKESEREGVDETRWAKLMIVVPEWWVPRTQTTLSSFYCLNIFIMNYSQNPSGILAPDRPPSRRVAGFQITWTLFQNKFQAPRRPQGQQESGLLARRRRTRHVAGWLPVFLFLPWPPACKALGRQEASPWTLRPTVPKTMETFPFGPGEPSWGAVEGTEAFALNNREVAGPALQTSFPDKHSPAGGLHLPGRGGGRRLKLNFQACIHS